MNWGPWYFGLWPGLARLWKRGEWSALVLATGFSLLLNVALISTFVWPEWIGSGFNAVVWPVLAVVWLSGCYSTWLQRQELFATPERAPEKRSEIDPAEYDRLFIEARREYLRRNWERAQLLLVRQLSRFPRDAASRLMLATVHRQSGNADSALAELDQLELFDQSLAWKFEISRERLLIARQQEELDEIGIESDDEESEDGSVGVVRDLRPDGSDSSIARAA